MKEFKQTLLRLQKNLDTLRQREASYAGSAPLDLLNQIEDHQQAITLTGQALAGELTEAEWREALKPLLVHIRDRTAAHPDWGVTIGDVEGGIIGAIIAGRDITAAGDIVTGVKQTASGSNIAQATHGGHAEVNVYNAPPRDKNLATLMGNVRQIWVEDYLNSALLNAIYLDLGLTEKRDAGAQPQPFEELNIRLRQPEQAERDLPPGTQAIDVYKQAGGGLLILGQPGAGKTTTLATLARDLLAEAEADPAAPVPVIFNLSSWAAQQKPLAAWLVEELNRQYQVSRKLAQTWLADGHLALLLDGLDEVAADRREACVAAINRYRDAEIAGPLVVCSRLHDYEALQTRLKLGQAIVLKKLTPAQIRHYFERLQTEQPPTNGPLAPLAERILQDDALANLTETPLMLNIITVTYAHPDAPPLPAGGGEQLQTHIFEAYTQRMFNRVGRTQITLLRPKETKVRYLQYLAAQLQAHSLTQFSVGQLKGSWLSSGKTRRQYHWLCILSFGLGVGFILGLSIGLIVALMFGLSIGLIGGLSVGLIIGLSGSLGDREPPENLRWNWRRGLKALGGGMLGGLLGAGSVGLLAEIGFVLPIRVAWGLIGGLSGGLSVGLIVGLSGGLIGGLSGVLSGGLIFGPSGGLINGLSDGLIGGLIVGLIFGLSVGLISGLHNTTIGQKVEPHEEVYRSWRNVLIGVLIGGLVGGLIFGLIFVLSDDLSGGQVLVLNGVLSFALSGGLIGSGDFLIQHYLRLYLLNKHNLLPFKLIPFLDQCTELIFLQRLGGSYRFIHRSVQEHFAAQWGANERMGE